MFAALGGWRFLVIRWANLLSLIIYEFSGHDTGAPHLPLVLHNSWIKLYLYIFHPVLSPVCCCYSIAVSLFHRLSQYFWCFCHGFFSLLFPFFSLYMLHFLLHCFFFCQIFFLVLSLTHSLSFWLFFFRQPRFLPIILCFILSLSLSFFFCHNY